MSGKERIAVVAAVVGGAAALLLTMFLLFGYGDEQDPGFTPDPSDTILTDVDEILTVDQVTWCKGFDAGIIFKLFVDALDRGGEYTFPTQDTYVQSVEDCLARGLPTDPIPFGETRSG